MKQFLIALLAISVLATASYAADEDSIGIKFSLDYNSNYLWRGTSFYNGDGVFLPSIVWDVAGTGLELSIVGELAESYIFEGSNSSINAVAYANHGLDFGADYSYTIAETITIGAGFWYYWYFNSATSAGTSRTNLSFLSANFLLAVDAIPLTPTFNVYYDYYTAIKRGGDIYCTLSVGHDFNLTNEVTLGLGLSAGYYYQNTAETTTYTGALPTDRTTTPIKKGFSDITTSLTMTYTKGMLGFTSGFNYIVVPAESWYKGSDIHRFYASFGVSLSI